VALAATLGAAASAAPPRTLDQRVAARLGADPKLAASLGKPAPQMAALGWMVGRWEVSASTAGKADAEKGQSVVTPALGGVWLEIRDTYPGGVQDIGYLTYDLVSRRWVSLSLDSLGNVNRTTSRGWVGGVASFEGRAVIVGEPARLRQVIVRRSPVEYTVTNEERLAGAWRRLDQYRYRKQP